MSNESSLQVRVNGLYEAPAVMISLLKLGFALLSLKGKHVLQFLITIRILVLCINILIPFLLLSQFLLL